MATQQQIKFEETIRAMKLALKRRADDSDSDTSIHAHTNRGNKLKRRAKYVREGRLDDTGGLAYRKQVDHAGYKRRIISNNPPLYDDDGDVFLPGESENERAVSPIEDDAFGGVQLEHLLRPLTAASELADHPSLSVAFKSKALTQMADEALEMVRREKECLWKAKRLLQRFRGDADWVPCEAFETEQDEIMLLSNGNENNSIAPSVAVEQSVPDVEVAMADSKVENGGVGAMQDTADDGAMNGVATADMASTLVEKPDESARLEPQQDADTGDRMKLDTQDDTAVTTVEKTHDDQPKAEKDADQADSTPNPLENPALTDIRRSIERTDSNTIDETGSQASNSGKEANANVHAMTTRARARSPNTPPSTSPTPSDSASTPQIHPWYLIPMTSLPDRDLGLPGTEAEETRRLLMLYVQKQEQVVRNLQTLYNGLQRADRLRREVYRSAKAEGHVKDDGKGNMVTEMSDGEDWYDPDDYGLERWEMRMQKDGTWGLEKGKDEVEDAEEEGRRGGRRRRVNRM